MTSIWDELQRPAPQSAIVDDIEIRRGSRVRLRPRAGGDVFDGLLGDRIAVIEGIDEAMDGAMHFAVTIADDPGRDLGDARFPGHRFYFSADEIEPLIESDAEPGGSAAPVRVLIAGIGNLFLGDDGFGVAVAHRLAARPRPAGVDVVDFGIRGMDLAYAMQDAYDAVIFVDAAPRGSAPGTLHVIDAAVDADGPLSMDAHGMDPVKTLALARTLGRVPPRMLVVGCEPEHVVDADAWDGRELTLSDPVRGAVDAAVPLIERLVADLTTRAGRHETANGYQPTAANEATIMGDQTVQYREHEAAEAARAGSSELGMSMLVMLGLAAGAGYLLAKEMPELRRYMKMRSM